MRKILILLTLWLPLLAMGADVTTDKFYINDFTIAPGEEKEIELNLLSTQDYYSFQVNIYLSEGLSFVFNEDEEDYIVPTERIPDGRKNGWPYLGDFVEGGDGSLLVTAYSPNLVEALEAGDGAVFTFRVKADEILTSDGIIYCKFSEMTNGEFNNFNGPDTECHVKVMSSTTLADLIAEGNTSKTYEVTDLIAIQAVDNGRLLLCKDNNGYASKDEIIASEDCIDFMHTAKLTEGIKSTIPVSYDQSNWIGLRIPDGVDLSASVIGCPLKGVVGKLVDAVNPELVLEQAPEANGEKVDFTPNVYIAASFGGTQHSAVSGKDYFFVTPKPMEYANVEWAQWNGEKFITPVHDDNHQNWNQLELTGEFDFNGAYLESGGVNWSDLINGHGYVMLPAVIKQKVETFDHLYVLGKVNGLNPGDWSPAKGVEMGTSDGKVYTTVLTVDDSGDEYGYFSFSKKLGSTRDEIHDSRIGADPRDLGYYGDYPVTLGQSLPLAENWKDIYSFKVKAGTYRLTVNLKTLQLVVTAPTVQAPRPLDQASKAYEVYPLNLERVTEENGGVITAIDKVSYNANSNDDIYYNLLGQPVTNPTPGIYIHNGHKVVIK